jgi:hypothetical protein
MTLSINDTQHNNALYYAECRILFIVMLIVIMLNFVILSVIMLSVIMLNVVTLSVVGPLILLLCLLF